MDDDTPHSRLWYERIAERQNGYYYPWSSTIDEGCGETAYDALVEQHLGPNVDLLDVGCGHGSDVLRLAGRVRVAVGYDRVVRFLEVAEAERASREIANARFVLGDSSTSANGGRPRLPIADDSIDLFVCRRGPNSWLVDARRVGRCGAVVLQLEAVPGPLVPWRDAIPQPFRDWILTEDAQDRVATVVKRVDAAKCELELIEVHQVGERLAAPIDLYKYLTFGRDPRSTPEFSEVSASFGRVFAEHGVSGGLEIPHCRVLWKARAGHQSRSDPVDFSGDRAMALLTS